MKVLCLVSLHGAVSSELCQWRESQELVDLILEAASCNSSIFTKATSSPSFSQEDNSTWDIRHTKVCACGLGWPHGGIYQLIPSAPLENTAACSLLGSGMWSGPPSSKPWGAAPPLPASPLSQSHGHTVNDQLKAPLKSCSFPQTWRWNTPSQASLHCLDFTGQLACQKWWYIC